MSRVLHIPGFSNGTVAYPRVTQSSEYVTYGSICHNNASICLNMPKCMSIFLNMDKYWLEHG